MDSLDERRPGVLPNGSPSAASGLIHGTGEMADLIRTYPWETSILGPIDRWPSSLICMLNVVLGSPLAAAIYWGPSLIFLGNDESVRMIGGRPSEVLALPAEILWGSEWPRIQVRLQAILDTGESFHGHDACFALPRAGKSNEIFVNYSVSPIYHDGLVAGVFRSLQETTESVLAMRALAESDARLRMALSAGKSVGVWDWHIHTNTVFSDETVASFYGIDPIAAAAGTSNLLYERMVHKDDLVVLGDAIMACITTGVDFSVDYRVRQTDDSCRWIRSMGRCVYDEKGHARRVTGVKLDVTGQRSEDPMATLPRNLFPEGEANAPPPAVSAFIAATINLLTEFPAEIKLRLVPGENATQIILRVAESDLGKLVGKGGRIIRSVRTLLYTVAAKCQHRFTIDVESTTKPWDLR